MCEDSISYTLFKKQEIILENRGTVTPELKPLEHKEMSTLELPEGAITRLGRGWISGGMTFSPDGESLVVASTTGCWWYDINTMKLSKTWDTEQSILCDITFSQDGKWLATGSWNGTVKIWDTQNLQCVAFVDLPKNPEGVLGLSRDLLFSQDGKYITRSNLISRDFGSGQHFTVYDWQTGTDTPFKSLSVQPEPGNINIRPIALSSDGGLIAYTSEANITSVMDIETGELIAKLRDDYSDTSKVGCDQLVFSPCGQYLAACNRGNKVHTWNVKNGTLAMDPTVYGDKRQLDRSVPAYTPNGNLQVAGFSNNEVVIWDATQQETVDTFEFPRPLYGSFSRDGTRFSARNRCGVLQVWTRENPSTVQSLPTHISRGVTAVKFSKDSRKLLSANDFSGYRLWDVTNRRVKQEIYLAHPNLPWTISISRSREFLAALVDDRIIRVWNLVSDKQIAELTEKYKGVTRMTFSPTAEYLVTTNIRKKINIWHIASSTHIAELSQNPARISRMTFSSTGEYFVSFYGDSFTIWDTTVWEKRHDVPYPVVQSSKEFQLLLPRTNEHVIIVPRYDPILVWDLNSGEQVGSLDTSICSDQSLYTGTSQDIQRFHEQQASETQRLWGNLRLSPCGTRIAGVIRRAGRNEIRLWDTTTLETYMVIIPPTGCQRPQSSTFSPCGKYLAVGAQWQEGQEWMSIYLLDVNTGENIHTFLGHPTDVWSLDFSPDGELLASGSYDGTILLWDVKSIICS